MRRGLVLALVVGTMALPVVGAASASIDLTVLSAVLPASATAAHTPIAFFVRDSSSLLSLEGNLASVQIAYFEKTETLVKSDPLPGLRVENPGRVEQTWSTDAAAIRLAGRQHGGILGADLSQDGVLLTSARDEATVAPRAPGSFPDGTVRTSARDDVPDYAYRILRAFLLHNVTGQVVYEGPGALKLIGPDIELITARNATRYETGVFPESDTQVRFKWLQIRFSTATVALVAVAPMEVATAGFSFEVDGLVHANVIHGDVNVDGNPYRVDPGPKDFEGVFSGDARPDGGSSATLSLNGELRRTTMAAVPVPSAPGGGLGRSWLSPFAGMAIVATAGGALAVLQYRRLKHERLQSYVEYCRSYAEWAAEAGNYTLAVEWLELAREHAPSSLDAAEELSLMYRKLGDLERAVALAEEVSAGSEEGDGNPPRFAAAMHMELAEAQPERAQYHLDAARVQIERALARDPDLARVIQSDPIFAPLHGPEFDVMLSEAQRRADDEWLKPWRTARLRR